MVGLPGEIGPVTQVAASGDHSLVVTASGQLYAFGSNFWVSWAAPPTTEVGESDADAGGVAGGDRPGDAGRRRRCYHSLVVTASGQLYAFGDN